MAGPEGLEPSTSDLEGPCSIQLSYEPAWLPFCGSRKDQASTFVMKTEFGSSQYPSNGGHSVKPAFW
jgi:hypothetical protein